MASTKEDIAPVDHSTPKQCHQKGYGRELEECPERRSLQSLQQSALDETALVGIGLNPHPSKNGKSTEKTKFKPSHGHIKLYHDDTTGVKTGCRHAGNVATESKGTQTDDSLLDDLIQQHLLEHSKRNHSFVEEEEGDAYDLMTKDPVPESYWKEVAEQRRLALSDTLEENKSLHQSIESLKEENEKLLEVASQAEQLSSLLQSVVSDDDEDKGKSTEWGETEGEKPATNEDHENEQCTESDPLNVHNGRESAVYETGEEEKPKICPEDDDHIEQTE